MHRRDLVKGMAGAAAAWPLAANAQQAAMPVVGFLSPLALSPAMASRLAGFLAGLSELQYVEGRNLRIDYRWAEGHYDRLPALAAELVRQNVNVIAALTQDAALAAKVATATVPIVFNIGGDPVQSGLVASMNRPGSNATGISMFTNQLEAKRLGLLRQMAPKITAVGVLINPTNASFEGQLKELHAAARSLGLLVHVRPVSSYGEFASAFESLVQAGAGALMVGADPYLSAQREALVVLAETHRLPAMWEWPDFVEAGGLMSYGTSIVDNYRQAGVFTGRILKGEAPAGMPVVQPVKFVLAINLRTARTLGIEVPATLLGGADTVID
jgi:putative ABC transport system substrate-binding protein